ncbi:MAG: AMP-binding protein [Desulfomonile tiedjei]|nr:AMP-binding protein [Desulfomonile tiedjei]
MNLAKRLAETAGRYPNKPAIIFEEAITTYGDLDKQISRYAYLLASLDLKPGDRVALQLPKCMEFILLEQAVLSVGGIVIPLNTDYRPEEMMYFLSDSGARLLFTDLEKFLRARDEIAKLRGIKTVLVDSEGTEGAVSLASVLEKDPRSDQRRYPAQGDDTAVICYTSGTTGKPKGAMLTHDNLISNMTALHEVWGWTDRDILLHVLPLFHVHGLFVALHGGLNAGATIIMHEKFDPLRTWEALGLHRCTVLMGVPTMYQRLMAQWDGLETKPDLTSMRLFTSGSAPLLETQFLRFEQATGFRILERYGMTETGMISSNTLDTAGRRAKSVGFPLPGVEVRVVSATGKDVTPGDVGEVWVRGANVFKGYWGMPEKTQESFDRGWFKTGDLGYQDPSDNDRLYLVGRAKELIITGGYNVYPKEVENVLEGYGAIREAAVIGLPDEDFGERVVAVVAVKENVPDVSSENIIQFCKGRLAGYKCPKAVFFLDALPRNAMGKLQKNILTDTYTQRPSPKSTTT